MKVGVGDVAHAIPPKRTVKPEVGRAVPVTVRTFV